VGGGGGRLSAVRVRDPREAGESGGSLQMTLNSCRDSLDFLTKFDRFDSENFKTIFKVYCMLNNTTVKNNDNYGIF
jgi:hypothetical protein